MLFDVYGHVVKQPLNLQYNQYELSEGSIYGHTKWQMYDYVIYTFGCSIYNQRSFVLRSESRHQPPIYQQSPADEAGQLRVSAERTTLSLPNRVWRTRRKSLLFRTDATDNRLGQVGLIRRTDNTFCNYPGPLFNISGAILIVCNSMGALVGLELVAWAIGFLRKVGG